MERFECGGMLLPHWPKGKKFKGNYWKADPVKAPKAGPEPIFTYTPKPIDAPADWHKRVLQDAFDLHGADDTGIHGSAHAKGKCKPDVCKYCKKQIPVSIVETSGRASIPESTAAKRQTKAPAVDPMDAFIDTLPPIVVAEVVKPAVRKSAKATPQLPAIPGIAPLGIDPAKFTAPAPVAPVNEFRAACLKPFTDAVATVTTPTVTAPVVTTAAPARKPSLLATVAEIEEKKTESGAFVMDIPQLADLHAEYKRLKAAFDAAEADLAVVKSKLCTELEPHRIAECRRRGEFRSSIKCEGDTFTSRHNWQGKMSKAEIAVFEAACDAHGVDAMKYVDSVFAVETTPAAIPPHLLSSALQHAVRVMAELSPETPDSVIQGLLDAGIKPVVVHKTAKVLHNDYTLCPNVEAVVKDCPAVKAVQPVLYFSR